MRSGDRRSRCGLNRARRRPWPSRSPRCSRRGYRRTYRPTRIRNRARAHARSGAPAEISGYLGKTDAFDKAIAAFASAYADQSERDHAILKKAVRSGRVEVVMEEG